MEKDINQKLDKYDVGLSISSGALTATLDALWIGDISLADAHKWGSDEVDEFVKYVAKSKGQKFNDVDKAIAYLEKEYKMDGDKLTAEFGGGKQHHLRDFSHHPTPVGLMCSLIMQFTGMGYGTDKKGNIVSYSVPEWERKSIPEAIYLGTVSWLFHIISDIAGSSGSRKKGSKGTGLPGPLLSFIKEVSSLPGVKNIMGKTEVKNSRNKEENYEFSVLCSKMFNGTLLGEHDENGKIILHKELRFDLRTELGIVNESIKNKQYLPVLLNEVIVASFYSVRRFMMQIEELGINSIDELKSVDVYKCLPFKNESIRHMRMIATSTFTSIDVNVAGIKAALKNKNNPSGFALDFMQGINYWGLGSLALASNSEFVLGIQKMQKGFLAAAEKQKKTIIEMLPNGQEDWDSGKYIVETAVSVAKIGTPIGFISATIGVYDEIGKALKDLDIAKEERIRIENECAARIEAIRDNRSEMEEMISNYLYSKMTVFTQAFSTMDKAVSENDIESFILGNNMIQTELSGHSMFNSMEEFEDMMINEDILKF